MKTILYNPIFINPQAYYVFPRLTRYLQPDNESTSESANYIGTIEVKVIAYGDTALKRTYTNTDSIDLSEFKNTWIRISLFTKVGSCVLGEWKIGNMESDLPYIDPEVLASLKAVVIVGNKTNNDSDRAIVKNLVDPDNPFVISNAAYTEGSGYADKGSPYYGAFVTDGIDDLITSTKTVQEMLGGSNEITVVSMIHQIDGNVNYTNGYTNYIRHGGGFIRNSVSGINGKGFNKTGIYGYTSTQLNSSNMGLGNVINNILGDKDDYSFERSSTYTLDDAKYSVQNFVNANNQPSNEGSSVAWYWTIIANKVLTTDQINQVIAYFNLDRTLNPDILCNTIKQGITNENHAEFGDKLIDFSGNGRDIQLNNIAWKGDSGIGKYETELSNTSIWTQSKETTSSPFSSSYNGLSGWIIFANTELTNSVDMPSFKIQVKGLLEGQELIYRYYDSNGQSNVYSITKDGDYTLPSDFRTAKPQISNTSGFQVVKNEANTITITQIPSHAGALCLDGVNDFGKVTGMPIYKDYTVVADYIRTSAKENAQDSPILSKSQVVNNGAFVFNYLNTNSVLNSYSFGINNGLESISDSERKIYYQSKYVNDGKSINSGTGIDYNSMWLGTYRDNVQIFFNGAIYSLMSFPYSMSEFLIERQLKKHKLGTLYPDMVEFRPIVKSNVEYGSIGYLLRIPGQGTVTPVIGQYYPILSTDTSLVVYVATNGADEVANLTINGQEPTSSSIHVDGRFKFEFPFNESPQNINITIDEYIRYEDIVQPYPVLLRFNDENGNEVSWGGKFRVGSTITRIGSIADPESNLLNGLYSISGLSLNGKSVTSSTSIVEKQMVFKTTATWLLDNNEPKVILSPSRLRIPNSSYKILGYIPDISGHGNHGVIHNSAYAEGSGVNEDGSYQFDGVDDHITIPTVTGGKQMLMKVNWDDVIADAIIYDQRGYPDEFAIYNADKDNSNNSVSAYQARNTGQTYIDGILNSNINASELKAITHNITITNELSSGTNNSSPTIGSNRYADNYFTKMSLYDFMLFDNISTEDKIKELNEYVGIEAKVELPPYYWDAYGKTNLDADKATIQQRGVAVGDYDITNYNHAYDKMSGYGGYEFAKFDNTSEWIYTNNSDTIEVVNRDGYSVVLRKIGNGTNYWHFRNTVIKSLGQNIQIGIYANKSVQIVWQLKYKLEGETDYNTLAIASPTIEGNINTYVTLPYKTEQEITDLNAVDTYYSIYFIPIDLDINEEVTIEMLPLYPNGLVYDGITDYSENANIPALTDYTYIVKREFHNLTNAATITKLPDKAGGGAFCADYNGDSQFSFGQYNNILPIQGISWQTKNSFNGTPINSGNDTDEKGLTVGRFSTGYANMVFYKLILYPKTIPLLQINFLKNLMERDEIIDLNNPIFIQE